MWLSAPKQLIRAANRGHFVVGGAPENVSCVFSLPHFLPARGVAALAASLEPPSSVLYFSRCCIFDLAVASISFFAWVRVEPAASGRGAGAWDLARGTRSRDSWPIGGSRISSSSFLLTRCLRVRQAFFFPVFPFFESTCCVVGPVKSWVLREGHR